MLTFDTNKICVLYVDDEEHNLHAFKANFRKSFIVYTAISVNEGKTILAQNTIHVLIIDHQMLIKSVNEELFRSLRESDRYTTILLTTFADIAYLENAVTKGKIHAYFQKPWDDLKLKTAIEEGYVLYNRGDRI